MSQASGFSSAASAAGYCNPNAVSYDPIGDTFSVSYIHRPRFATSRLAEQSHTMIEPTLTSPINNSLMHSTFPMQIMPNHIAAISDTEDNIHTLSQGSSTDYLNIERTNADNLCLPSNSRYCRLEAEMQMYGGAVSRSGPAIGIDGLALLNHAARPPRKHYSPVAAQEE
jgi:hypothetical protein